MDKQKILVTFANVYDVEGVRGMTLNYFFFGDHGELMESRNDLSGGPVGYQRAKCSMDYNDRAKVSYVPGIYEASFSMAVGSDGKPVLKVTDLNFVARAEIRQAAPAK